jgi:hypothetical protein
MAYKRFKRLEVFWHSNFHLGIDNGCGAGCVIVSLGWVGFAWLGEECL